MKQPWGRGGDRGVNQIPPTATHNFDSVSLCGKKSKDE